MTWRLMGTAPTDGSAVDLKRDNLLVLGCRWQFCDIGPHGRYAWAYAPTDFKPTHWRPAERSEAASGEALPESLSGHWATPAGREMAQRYAAMERAQLGMADCTDLELANAIYLVDGRSLDLIVLQSAAKERIRWLSVQLALARAPTTTEAADV